MSWSTISQCRDFLRGATAYPEYGLVKTDVDLPGKTRRWNQRSDMRTLGDYWRGDVAESFYDFTRFISDRRIDDFLNHSYVDSKSRSRKVSQLGGHTSSYWGDKGIHLTQRSDTFGYGRPNQYHHFVMEHEGGAGYGGNAAMFVARNLAFTAMAGSRDGVAHLLTAATGFVTTKSDLIDGLNGLLSARDMAADRQLLPSATLLQISAALYLINYGDRPARTGWVGDRAVSAGNKGKAEVANLKLPNRQFLAAVLNNIRDAGSGLWEREFFCPGIVPMNQELADRFVAQQGWKDGPAILDKMASDGLDLHAQVYGALTRVVAEGTGMGR